MTLIEWIRTDHGPVFNRLKPLTFALTLPILFPIAAFQTLHEEGFFGGAGDLIVQMAKSIWTGKNGAWE